MSFGRTEAEKEAERLMKEDGYYTWRALVCPLQTRGPGGAPIGWFTRRADLWGVIDIAGMRFDGFEFVQVCTESGLSAHRRKIEAAPWPTKNDGYSVKIYEAREGRDPFDARRVKRGFRTHLYDVVQRTWGVTGFRDCLPPEKKEG